MSDMNVKKLQVDLAKTIAKAGEVARFMDSTPRTGLDSYLLRNLWAIAHAASHVLFRTLTRMATEMISKVDQQMSLFDTPSDHAMTVRELEDWVDNFKGVLLGDYETDDAGKNDFELPDLARRIKTSVASQGESGLSWEEIGEIFDGETHSRFGADVTEAVVWCMVHLGELEQAEGDRLVAVGIADSDPMLLTYEVMATLEASPGLGTEEGLQDSTYPVYRVEGAAPPDLVDAVSVRIFSGDGATEAELVEVYKDEQAVQEALNYLIDQGKVEAVPMGDGTDDSPETIRYMPPGQDLDSLHGDTLRAVYERETGEKAGRKGEARMREEISEKRNQKGTEESE